MPAIPKLKRVRDTAYLSWVSRQPCCVTGQTIGVDAHHVIERGHGRVGSKVSDRRTVPLIRALHSDYHNIGREAFQVKYRVDLESVIVSLNQQYNADNPPKPEKQKQVSGPPQKRIQRSILDAYAALDSVHVELLTNTSAHQGWAICECPIANALRTLSGAYGPVEKLRGRTL